MKPHIRKENITLTYRSPMWFCRGSKIIGLGDTAKNAYWDWRWRINQKAGVAQ